MRIMLIIEVLFNYSDDNLYSIIDIISVFINSFNLFIYLRMINCKQFIFNFELIY